MKSSRRNFIKAMGTSAAGLTIGATTINSVSCSSQTSVNPEDDGQILFIGDNIALADTRYGKVKGYILVKVMPMVP